MRVSCVSCVSCGEYQPTGWGGQGTAEMQVVLGESRYFFTVTTAMMCVLHRFAFGQAFSLGELQEETAIPDRDLKRALFSLISPLQGMPSRARTRDYTNSVDTTRTRHARHAHDTHDTRVVNVCAVAMYPQVCAEE